MALPGQLAWLGLAWLGFDNNMKYNKCQRIPKLQMTKMEYDQNRI